jgi:superfamily II DNA or RNA helicase
MARNAREDAERLMRCAVLFEAGDPPRDGRMSFWEAGDDEPPDAVDSPGARAVAAAKRGSTWRRPVPVARVPVRDALPVLAQARHGRQVHPAAAFWGAVSVLALQLVARGRMRPGVSAGDMDTWRVGPLDAVDVERVRELAASMPEAARVPPAGAAPARTSRPEALIVGFLDAVVDGMPRTPAAARAAGGLALAAAERPRAAQLPDWAREPADGSEPALRASLRIELPDADEGPVRAVVQVRSLEDPALVADAAELWSDAEHPLGPRARIDTLLALRRGARVWAPLVRLLHADVPDALTLGDDEVEELLGGAVARLASAGIDLHWPRELARDVTARAVVAEPVGERAEARAFFGGDALLRFDWQLALGGERLSDDEMDRLAEAHRPIVRLRDRWVLVDPELVRKARERSGRPLRAIDALGAALTGRAAIDGELVEIAPSRWLDTLRELIADPDGGREPVQQPAAMAGTLRDYQLRGLRWLDRMTSLGLGCCLADDMGLGKTITLIAFHLHRQLDPDTAGPTLVVCPASLLGNWEREIQRFAPGEPVRRYHGPDRVLGEVAAGFVLTTYGTMRLDAPRLRRIPWGLLVADEAQFVKNALSATARQLRRIPAGARIALTGTPMENNLSELWAILDWTTPGLLGTRTAFRAAWAKPIEADGDGEAAARLARLVAPFLLRRRKSDPGIAPELPPKTETDQPVALTQEQAALYEAVVREAMAEIHGTGGMARRGLVLKLLTALKQICNHPAQYLGEPRAPLVGRSGKLRLLDDLVDQIVAEGGAVLVFTQYVAMAALLERHLAERGIRVQLLHGGTPVARRDEMVQRFQAGEVPVFLLSLRAGGTGLNLTRADHVIHYDRWWNPAVEDQATDRAHRIGQTRPVQVHRLIAEGTLEDRIAAMLQSKRDLAEAVLRSGESALTELSDDDLATLVELQADRSPA